MADHCEGLQNCVHEADYRVNGYRTCRYHLIALVNRMIERDGAAHVVRRAKTSG